MIIEPTSGNTGIGIAALAAALGYRAVIVMPDSMSAERVKLIAAYGARGGAHAGRGGHVRRGGKGRRSCTRRTPAASSPANLRTPPTPAAHYMTTGPEIWRDTDGKVAAFVAGVGTGGTITGVGRYLKERNPDVRIIAVEPASSPLLSEGRSGPHAIQGIGANFVPKALDTSIYDEIIAVPDDAALDAMRALARTEGLLCGVSSGAAAWAAKAVAERPEFAGKLVVCLLPDTGERYLSVM